MNVWKQFSGSMTVGLDCGGCARHLPFTPCNCPAQEPTANDWQQGIKLLLESLNHADAGRAKECTAAAEEFIGLTCGAAFRPDFILWACIPKVKPWNCRERVQRRFGLLPAISQRGERSPAANRNGASIDSWPRWPVAAKRELLPQPTGQRRGGRFFWSRSRQLAENA